MYQPSLLAASDGRLFGSERLLVTGPFWTRLLEASTTEFRDPNRSVLALSVEVELSTSSLEVLRENDSFEENGAGLVSFLRLFISIIVLERVESRVETFDGMVLLLAGLTMGRAPGFEPTE